MNSNDDAKDIRARMLEILEQLDRLGHHGAGAHLSMAVHCLERESPNLVPSASWTAGSKRWNGFL